MLLAVTLKLGKPFVTMSTQLTGRKTSAVTHRSGALFHQVQVSSTPDLAFADSWLWLSTAISAECLRVGILFLKIQNNLTLRSLLGKSS